MSNYTHEIVRIERGETKGSRSPMWKCLTSDGQTVNVFQHTLPERNTFDLLVQAGYADLSEMAVGDVQRWRHNFPIKVQLVKDGDWWKLAAVEPRPKDAHPDAEWKPDVQMYQNRAELLARLLTNKRYESRYFDFESTGVESDDEMVAASVIHANGLILFDEMLMPRDPSKLLRPGKYGKTASEVNGITPDKLASCQLTEDALTTLAMILSGRVWIAYNAPFDVGLLERECLRYGHPLIYSLGIHDAMQIFAEYLGEWQPNTQKFKTVTLSRAAQLLDIDPGQTHTAKSDALTTLEIMRAMAAGKLINNQFEGWV